MRSAVSLGDVVGEAEDVLLVGVVPLHGDLDTHLLLLDGEVQHAVVNRRLIAVQMLDERLDAALVLEDVLLAAALVEEADAHAGIEKRQLAQALSEDVVVELDVGKGLGARLEQDVGTGALGLADDLQGRLRLTVTIFLAVGLTVPVNGHDQLLGEGVHH